MKTRRKTITANDHKRDVSIELFGQMFLIAHRASTPPADVPTTMILCLVMLKSLPS